MLPAARPPATPRSSSSSTTARARWRLGAPEISIVRRLDRNGEGEYRLAGARCRLVDVVELLSDTGLGKEMHSVISQGRVESIVTSKPRERRLLIEEAAGLGKHRKRRRRAQLKLARTQDNLDRALDVEREARSRLRPLKRQAEAAELHARLERQSLEIRWELAREESRAQTEAVAAAQTAAGEVRARRKALSDELGAVAARREAAEETLAARSAQREELSRRSYAARSAAERVAYRAESTRSAAAADRAAAGPRHRGAGQTFVPRPSQISPIPGRPSAWRRSKLSWPGSSVTARPSWPASSPSSMLNARRRRRSTGARPALWPSARPLAKQPKRGSRRREPLSARPSGPSKPPAGRPLASAGSSPVSISSYATRRGRRAALLRWPMTSRSMPATSWPSPPPLTGVCAPLSSLTGTPARPCSIAPAVTEAGRSCSAPASTSTRLSARRRPVVSRCSVTFAARRPRWAWRGPYWRRPGSSTSSSRCPPI